MTGRHFAATLDSLRYFFRSQLTLAFPSPIDQSQTPKRSVSRSQRDASVGSMPKNCQKIAKKLKGKLKASRSDPRLQGQLQRSLGRLMRSGLALSRARHALARGAGLGCGVEKKARRKLSGDSSQPAPADVEPHNTPRRCARVHRVTGFFAEASNERTNARYPSAHGSAGRRRGPGARANPIAAVGGTPPRRR